MQLFFGDVLHALDAVHFIDLLFEAFVFVFHGGGLFPQIFRFLADVVDSRYLLLLLVQTALFTAMYAALPNKQNPAGECVPGAVLASVGWQGFSAVFSLYVDNFNRYANIYGSVYAVALSMLWLYCCIFIIFLGGAFNRFLAWYRQEKKNK